MEHSNLHVVLGPPGTGKTTKLLNLVENHLNNGILPDHIGYLAFTKKAATEAIDRACVKFDYQIQQLPYFRTIHSLCFQLLGLKRDDVMGKSHYKELGEMLGIEITGASTISEGASFGMTNGDRLFFLENLARIKRIPLRQVYDESNYLFYSCSSPFCRFADVVNSFLDSRLFKTFGLPKTTINGFVLCPVRNS